MVLIIRKQLKIYGLFKSKILVVINFINFLNMYKLKFFLL